MPLYARKQLLRPQRASIQLTGSLAVQQNPMKIICAYWKYFGNHLGRTTQLISSKKLLLVSTYKCNSVARIHRIRISLAWSRDHVFPTSLIIIGIKRPLLKTYVLIGICCKLSNMCVLLRLTICHMFSYWKSQFFCFGSCTSPPTVALGSKPLFHGPLKYVWKMYTQRSICPSRNHSWTT
jgi:hypothetical protein